MQNHYCLLLLGISETGQGTSLKTSDCYDLAWLSAWPLSRLTVSLAAQTFFGPAKLNVNYSKDTFQLTNFFGNF